MQTHNRKYRAAAALLAAMYSLLPCGQMHSAAAEPADTWISLDNQEHWTHAAQDSVCGKRYSAFSYDVLLQGYADQTLLCKWDSLPDDPDYRSFSLTVGRSFNSYSIIDHQGSTVFNDSDELRLSYSLDIEEIAPKSEHADWRIGASVLCMRKKPADPASDLLGSETVCSISIVDCSENDSLAGIYNPYTGLSYYEPPVDLGTITSEGVQYDVKLLKNAEKSAIPFVSLTRREMLEPSASGDIPEGCVRYENSISMTDIFNQLKQNCIDLGGIYEAEFSLVSTDTSGTIHLNAADFERIIPDDKRFSEDDCRLLEDFLLGEGMNPHACDDYQTHSYEEMDLETYLLRMMKDYDLNRDGKWSAVDLSLMRSRCE